MAVQQGVTHRVGRGCTTDAHITADLGGLAIEVRQSANRPDVVNMGGSPQSLLAGYLRGRVRAPPVLVGWPRRIPKGSIERQPPPGESTGTLISLWRARMSLRRRARQGRPDMDDSPGEPVRVRVDISDSGGGHKQQLGMGDHAVCRVLARVSCSCWLPAVVPMADDARVCPGGERWARGGSVA